MQRSLDVMSLLTGGEKVILSPVNCSDRGHNAERPANKITKP